MTNGVGKQVEKDLDKLPAVGESHGSRLGVNIKDEPFGFGERPHLIGRLFQRVENRDLGKFDLRSPSVQSGKVQRIVDQLQKVVARHLDVGDVTTLLLIELARLRIVHQMREPENG